MSETSTASAKLYDLFIFYLGRIIGWLCAGFATFFLIFVHGDADIKSLFKDAGSTIVIVSVFVIGFIVYNFYYRLAGEIVIYRLQHFLQKKYDEYRGRTGDKQTSPVYLLIHYGVAPGRARQAYAIVKRTILKSERHYIQVVHAEIHSFYIGSLSLLAESIIDYVNNYYRFAVVFSLLFLVFISLSMIFDTLQHAREAEEFKPFKREILALLTEHGFIKSE